MDGQFDDDGFDEGLDTLCREYGIDGRQAGGAPDPDNAQSVVRWLLTPYYYQPRDPGQW
ncbi:hypothetical protein [Nocardioides maradonensis]